MKKENSYLQQLTKDRVQKMVKNTLFKDNPNQPSKEKMNRKLDQLEHTMNHYQDRLEKMNPNQDQKRSHIEAKLAKLEKTQAKLRHKKYRHLTKEKDKLAEIKTKVDEADSQTSKLQSKVNKMDSKLSKMEESQVSLSDKTQKISQDRRKMRKKLDSSFKTPFSTDTVGKRTLLAKAVAKPIKTATEPLNMYHSDLKREMSKEGAEGVQMAHTVISPMARRLKQQTTQSISKTVGFDRKATKLEKMNNKSLKLEKDEFKLIKNQRKKIRKKAMYQKKQMSESFVQRVAGFLTLYKNNLLTKVKLIKNKSLLFFASGALAVLLLVGILVPLLVVLGAGGGAIINESSFNSNMGIDHAFDIEIDLSSEHYQSASPYTAVGLRGQCTWFVWGRIREVFGIEIPSNMGHGGQWFDSAINLPFFLVGNEPKAGSIMVLRDSTYGHVSFVESVDPNHNTMIISEGNIGNPMSGTSGMATYAHQHYAKLVVVHEVPMNVTSLYGMTLVGYIYLDHLIHT